MITHIVSGGQSGADRSALDFALSRGIPHGGWCPKGRRAEDGPIDPKYLLKETATSNYLERTELNIRDSDATVIFTHSGELSGGSLKTKQLAAKLGKPCLHLSMRAFDSMGRGLYGPHGAVAALHKFVNDHKVFTLNVAGSRNSKEPGIGSYVVKVLEALYDSTGSI